MTCNCDAAQSRKTNICLLTGFLGAGKTTLLKELMSSFHNRKIGVIVNDFGKVNIDYQLVETEGLTMAEVSNGSIFCACVKDKFVDSLIAMASYDLELLFIEASGLADPSNIQPILDGIARKTNEKYEFTTSLCVIDGEHFIKMSGILPALKRQVENSGIILVNKADLFDLETKAELIRKVHEFNAGAEVIVTTYCRFDVGTLFETSSVPMNPDQETSNTPETRPVTISMEAIEPLDFKCVKAFLKETIPSTYRLKGFIQTHDGDFEVSAVNERIEIKMTRKSLTKTELIAISSVGITLYNVILKASKTCLGEKMKIS
ncbi:hypothetical protein AKG39_00190 [Acetobacterium bakii]|uniref:CobW/HypB/UreG nucleotide-binding domain-containing protein n=1 Tax=Acetobacterium bakii TaxID=52689 RepID=A0A0L6U531_9FIRM|nr:hypothetical protein AKG39_00190 [Acetobacterium bakii]